MKEQIKHAVVKSVCGMIILGKCHADCFWQGKNIGLKMSSKSEDQGFFTNKGRYVNRKLAARIAKRAGQLDLNDKRRKVSFLISEDIWYQRERFEYSQSRGYFEVLNNEKK
jgi:hypothetical protein